MKPERLLARIEICAINIGIFLEKRRLLLNEIDVIDNRSKGKLRLRNLKQKAGRLEVQILRLQYLIRKDRAKLLS